MAAIERLKTGRDLKVEKYCSVSSCFILQANQKGAIIIGVIITMVIISALGAGMLNLTTSSTFQNLMVNNNASAYYIAESGGRYASNEIRDAYATSVSKVTNLKSNLEKTYTINNGGSFEIKDVVASGNPAVITFTSVGTVGSGFMAAKRQINYVITPADQTMAPVASIYSADEMVSGGKGSFATVTSGANEGAIKVLTAVDDGNAQRFASAYFDSPVNFLNIWNSQNRSLSYSAQVKLKVQRVSPYYSAGLAFRLHPVGGRPRGFHLDFMRFSTFANTDGIPAAYRTASPWVGELKHPNMEAGATYLILWLDEEWSSWEILLAYKKLDEFTSGVLPVPVFLDNMEVAAPAYVGSDRNGWTVSASDPWGWNTNDNNTDNTGNRYGASPHSWNIDLQKWGETESSLISKQIDASSISTTGELSFAYKVKNRVWQLLGMRSEGTAWICTGAGATSCTRVFDLPVGNSASAWGYSTPGWMHVTIPVPSGITLTNTTFIKFIAESRWNGRITWYVDDVKLARRAPKPNNSTILVQLEEKNLTTGNPSTRRNVIKTYYSTTAYNPVATINWPPAAGMTLVDWDWIQLNYKYNATNITNIDDIADKTVIQTKWYRTYPAAAPKPDTTSGWYNVTNSYDEVGLTAFGTQAAVENRIFFRDFALKIGGGGGNSSGSGTVVQY